MLSWHDAIQQLEPHIFKISTPNAVGSGWLLTITESTGIAAIATAAHVVEYAYSWDLPIRIYHEETGESVLLHNVERAVFLEAELGTAVIVFKYGSLKLPKKTVSLMREDNYVLPGVEIGWLGYPAIPRVGRSFFSGRVSSYDKTNKRYFIDGVAINGISGGPAFRLYDDNDDIRFIGVVSAYISNRATGESLPGVAVVQDVTQLYDVTKRIKSFEVAKKKESTPEELPTEELPTEELPTEELPTEELPKEELPKEELPKEEPPKEELFKEVAYKKTGRNFLEY